MFGRIVEIITPSDTSTDGAVAVLDLFCLGASRHPIFGMPVLSHFPDGCPYLKDVQFLFNAQHDCAAAKCTLNVYLINTHSLHNAHLLRRVVPRDLIAPVPVIGPSERQAEHAKLSAAWRGDPKSHTAREQAREEKRAEAATNKKGNIRGKKRSVDEAFKEEEVKLKVEAKEEMVLISELDALPQFLAGVGNRMTDPVATDPK